MPMLLGTGSCQWGVIMGYGAAQVGDVTVTRLEEAYGPAFPADMLF